MKAPNWKPTQRAPDVVLCPRCGLPGGRPLFTSIDPCARCSDMVPPEVDPTDEFDMPLYLVGPGKLSSCGPVSAPSPAPSPTPGYYTPAAPAPIPSGAMYAGTVVNVTPVAGQAVTFFLSMSVVSASVVSAGAILTAARIYPDVLVVSHADYVNAVLTVLGARAIELKPFDILYCV